MSRSWFHLYDLGSAIDERVAKRLLKLRANARGPNAGDGEVLGENVKRLRRMTFV